MALVAYTASSGESENESDVEENRGEVKINGSFSNVTGTNGNQLFERLPTPITNGPAVEEEEVQDEFLLKKEIPAEKPKKSVKISIPSLADFDSEEDDEKPVQKNRTKQSGLFATLPPPRGIPLSNTTFVPQVLKRRAPPPVPKKKPPQKPAKKPKTEDPTTSESEDETQDNPEPFDVQLWEKLCKPQKRVPKKPIAQTFEVKNEIEIAPEPDKPYDGLDNKAFKELVGSSKIRRENIKLVDINEEEVLPEKDLWLTKSLTDPNLTPKEEPVEEINNTQRRKHHITYLAQQAKANEQELQTQWSQNKYNRKLTQSKYGF